jgi:hypothetical protein
MKDPFVHPSTRPALSRVGVSCVVAAACAGAVGAQTCPTSFTGVSQFHCDSDVASGRTQVLIIEHDFIRAFDKCGNSIYGPVPLDGPAPGFYSSVTPAPVFDTLSDPEVHFDPVASRFWAVAQYPNNGTGTVPGGAYLAVSDSQDATAWPSTRKYYLEYNDACATTFFDQVSLALHGDDAWIVAMVTALDPTLGCDPQHVKFSEEDWNGYGIARVSKSGAENGLPLTPVWRTVAEWARHNPVPVRNLSTNAPVQYVVARNRDLANNPNGGELLFYPLSFDAGTGTIVDPIPLKYALPVPAYYTPPSFVPQPPGGGPFNLQISQDGRCWSAVYRNGSVWVAFPTGDVVDSTRSLIRVHEIQMNGWTGGSVITPVLRQTITIDPGNQQSAFSPSIAVQSDDLAAVTFGVVGPNANQFFSVQMSYRCASDPLNWMHPSSALYTAPGLLGQSGGIVQANHYSGTKVDSRIAGRFWYHHGLACTGIDPSIVGRFDPACGLDMNGDGGYNVGDQGSFQESLVIGAPEADFEPDGTPTIQDAQRFEELRLPPGTPK